MFRRWLLFFSLIFFTIVPRGQLATKTTGYRVIYAEAEKLYTSDNATEITDSLALLKYQAVIDILKKKPADDSILFDSYLKTGILLTSQKKDRESLQNFLSALSLNQASKSVADSLSFLPWLFAGNNYYNIYNPDSALYCYKQAEKLLNVYPKLPEAERLYNKTGVLYYEAGDFNKSVFYFTRALSMVDTTTENSRYFIVNYKNNIASALRKLHGYARALEMYKSLQPYNIYTGELLHNIGDTYLDAGDYRQALNYLKKVPYNNASKYNDVARAYLNLQVNDSAEININAALKTYIKPPFAGQDHANTLKLSGDLLMARQMPAAALTQYHKTIMETAPGFIDTVLSKNPSAFSGLSNFYFLFDVLAAKAQAFEELYKNKPAGNLLSNAFSTYGSALALAEYMEKVYGTDESRLFLRQNVEAVYKTAVETGLQLFELRKDSSYINKVFNYIENSKASVLQAGLFDIELSTIKGMPVGLLQEQRKLKAVISGLNVQVTQTTDSFKIAALQKQVQDSAIQLSRIQERLNENAFYRKLKFGTTNISISEIRNLLTDDESILSFYNTGKQLVCYYLNKQQFGYVKVPVSPALTADIKQLKLQLNAPDGGDNKTIDKLSRSLYSQLIGPVSGKITSTKRLIIIPHNEISYIPFEILASPADGRLLMEDYSVSYQYSANFLNTKQSSHVVYKVLAMAPFTQKPVAGGLPQLPASYSEIEDLPGLRLADSSATKTAFIQFSGAYPVIHLATHATADDSLPANSYINFYGAGTNTSSSTRLYEQEIYHLDLANTRLAILSACETGTGQLINSEGIISLSRAFSYAGCKSVVTSLWKADDIATAFITKKLHAYLQSGLPLDEALQKAKLDYLKSDGVDSRFKKPSYWANLILIGDAHAITAKKTRWYIEVTAILLLIALVVYIKKAMHRK